MRPDRRTASKPRADELHRIVDRHAGGHDATRRIDVKRDFLLRVFSLEEKQLRADERGHLVFHRSGEENDAFLEKTGKYVVGAFAAIGLLNDHRHQSHGGINWIFHVRPLSTLPFADNRSGITSNLHSPYIECPCPALQDTKPHILNGSTAFAGRRARRGKGFEPDEACRGPFTCRHHFFTMPGNDGKNCLPCTDITSHRQELVRYLLLILPGEFPVPVREWALPGEMAAQQFQRA